MAVLESSRPSYGCQANQVNVYASDHKTCCSVDILLKATAYKPLVLNKLKIQMI